MKNPLIIIINIIIFISFTTITVRSSNLQKKDEPMSIEVTYVTPLRDLEEQTKYMEEHLNYVRNFKRTEDKLKDDIQTIKMMLNEQNTQIEKLNSIVHSNFATARELKFRKTNN